MNDITIESHVELFAQPHTYTPCRAVSIEKHYMSPGTTCYRCGKGIATNLPAISVMVRHADNPTQTTSADLHDRCLGRFLLDGLIENEGDAIGGFLHETIISNATR